MQTNSDHTTPRARLAVVALVTSLLAACGAGSDSSGGISPPIDTRPVVTDLSTTSPPTTAAPATDSTVDDVEMAEFAQDAADRCDRGGSALASLPPPDGTIETLNAQIAILQEWRAEAAALPPVEVPAALADQAAELEAIDAAADAALADAAGAAATGDVQAASAALGRHLDAAGATAARLAIMGVPCDIADPVRAASAAVNVLLELNASQINVGFGSVWVSETDNATVVRIEPETGEILARIDVADGPLKLQPADGMIWVRTSDRYERIDPATNTVDATLLKADVGPAANRNWALDGVMWICDGRTLHRYDLSTMQPVASVDVGIDCDYVYATSELVVVWVYNDDPSLAADPATVMIDPATNEVLATIALPAQMVFPAILDDSVFFAGNGNSTAVTIDRSTWTIAATYDLGRTTGGGGIVTDGTSIFVPTDEQSPNDVLVVDTSSFDVVGVVEPLDVNHLALLDGSLWITDGTFDVVQRFDL